MNSWSNFHYSKLRIQDGGRKKRKKHTMILVKKNMYAGVFEDAGNESVIRFL